MINKILGKGKSVKGEDPRKIARGEVLQSLSQGEIPSNMILPEIALAFLEMPSQVEAKGDFWTRYVDTVINCEDEILSYLQIMKEVAAKEGDEPSQKTIDARIEDIRSTKNRYRGVPPLPPEPLGFLISHIVNIESLSPNITQELVDRFMEFTRFGDSHYVDVSAALYAIDAQYGRECQAYKNGEYNFVAACHDASVVIRRIHSDVQENRNMSEIRKRILESNEISRIANYYNSFRE